MAGLARARWWIWLYCTLLLAVCLSTWVNLDFGFRTAAWDFLSLYTGARMVLEGHGDLLYNRAAQLEYQERLIAPRRVASGGLPFYYPPQVLPFLLPFSLGSLSLGYILWLLFSLLLVVVLLFLSWRYLGIGREGRLTFALAVVSFYPLSNHLMQGQTTLLVVLGFMLTLMLLRKGREVGAGLALSLGSIKPPLILPLLLVLLGKRRWRVLAGFLLGVGFLLLPTWPFLNLSAPLDYVLTTVFYLGTQEKYGIFPQSMHNWRAFSVRLLGAEEGGQILWLGLTLLSLGILIGIWHRPWEENSPHFRRQFAGTILLTTLLSPHLNLHDLVLWVLTGALLAGEGRWGWWLFLPLGSTVSLLSLLWPWAFGPPTVLFAAAALAFLLGEKGGLMPRLTALPFPCIRGKGKNIGGHHVPKAPQR